MTFVLKKTIDRLINKAVNNSSLPARFLNKEKDQKIFPCITVSRETGSGGRWISKLVAKKLKMKYYDKDFVELIAKNANKRKDIIEDLDERSSNIIEEIISSLYSPQNKLSRASYLKYLCRTILALVKKNKAVILGRGANYIIPAKYCLRVRIIAPLKTRIANAIKFEKRSPLNAREHIKKKHFGRKDFVKRYFNKNISDANYYDLVINTEYMDLKPAAALIIKAFKEKFPKACF